MPMSVQEVASLFPNLMDISDASLREKVAAVWSEAIETGCGGKGWTTDELRAVPFTLLAGDIDVQNCIAADRGKHNRRCPPAGPTSAAAGVTPISP